MNNDELAILRHSAAHLLAQAVLELYPEAQLTIGPATQDGFFYDFALKEHVKEEDLPRIEERMREIAARGLPIVHTQMPKKQARQLYKNNPFKLELIEQIPEDTVGIATQGEFADLCRGGHVANTKDIKHFKLLSLSGAYWRANKNNAPLQRVYGTAFFTQDELDSFQKQREEAKKYDHRRLGKELDLFSFHEEGTGFPFFHPRGMTILNTITDYLRSMLYKGGYQEIATPIMLSDQLWRQSGHYDHYRDNMYFSSVEDRQYAIRPMNCPGAILLYKERPHSYRELPMRFSEFGKVHRYELSGVLHGLFRARAFTIDDGHIFCTPDQIDQEIISTIEMIFAVFKRFGFHDIRVAVSTRPENAMGSKQLWERAINALTNALDSVGVPYTIQEGEGAFYGPKIEFLIRDSMGREWQCGTVQVDFFQPENFDLTYVTTQGTKARPVMIHRAVLGSFERFLGILVEHHKGRLPFWLAPMQVAVLSITDDQQPYAQEIARKLEEVDVRAYVDQGSDPISGKIKHAQLQNIPWMVVVGKREMSNGTVTLRYLSGEQEQGVTVEELIAKSKKALG